MNRSIVAALGLLACSGTAGQSSGDLTLIGAPGAVVVAPAAPVVLTPAAPGDFQLIFTESNARVFVIGDFSAMSGNAMRQADQREHLVFDASLQGEPVLLTIEGDGVRLPDKRLNAVTP